MEPKVRKIAMVVNKYNMHEHDQSLEDLKYWLTKTPIERVSAVTFLIQQHLKPGQRMDKTKFKKIQITK
ncbi:hypothetical protein H7U22_05585 [Pedobacter sp. CCM 8938]|uniref:Uncharacterized protein n=2 Tax=Pedobacter fastidiosus TaxID=2765361 RepID=A0ABR7KPH0_9SPHI|nr:hypothetical protein [Pedobacter fastidiosus]MBC6109888.1 hypothetical protein [Pedobacter fastidiosus]